MHLWQNLQSSRPNDISSIGVAGLLLIVGVVWGATRSQIILLSATEPPGRFLSQTCAQTHKVKSQAVLLIMPEFIPRRNKLNCVLFLHQKLSLRLPPQLSSRHQRSDPKVSQPREPQGISGSSVYRQGDDPEHCEGGPHFPGCTCRACRQGSNTSLRANSTHFPLCWATAYGGS